MAGRAKEAMAVCAYNTHGLGVVGDPQLPRAKVNSLKDSVKATKTWTTTVSIEPGAWHPLVLHWSRELLPLLNLACRCTGMSGDSHPLSVTNVGSAIFLSYSVHLDGTCALRA